MKFSIILVSALVSIAVAASSVPAGVTVVDDIPGRLVVDVDFTGGAPQTLELPGAPPLRFERLWVALPSGAVARVDRVEGAFTDSAALPERRPRWADDGTAASRYESGMFPAQPVRISGPVTFRRTRMVAVDCFASQVDYASGIHRVWPEYRVVVTWPATRRGAAGKQDITDPFVRAVVANRSGVPAEPRLSRQAVPDPHFSLSSNWVKLTVNAPGVYTVTGSDLIGMGIALGSIADPNSFRLFTAGGREQVRDLAAGVGTWMPGTWMEECDIVVDYGGDGTFDPGDRVVFYGLGSRGFTDLYEPGAPRDEVSDHDYTKENYYYLTWDSGFPGTPGRAAVVAAAPTASTPMTTFEERIYFEEEKVDELSFGGDGWVWLDVSEKTGPETFRFDPGFTVRDLDASQSQTFRTVALAQYKDNGTNFNHHARYRINGTTIGDQVWTTADGDRYDEGVQVALTGTFLQEGNNLLELNVPRDLNANDHMFFAWYSVFYHRRLKAFSDALSFSSPDSLGSIDYSVTGFSAGTAPIYVLDVTQPWHPTRLTGVVESPVTGGRNIRFAATVGATRRAYYWAGTIAGMRSPARMLRYVPRDLRDKTVSPHMIIITDSGFLSAAQLLRQHRLQHLPLVASPRVEVVTTTEVFDNFSGGQIDPMAIRNYCKFLYDNFSEGNGPTLTYVLLLGDATVDFKNNRGGQPNFVTTTLNLNPFLLEAYASDEPLVLMDPGDTPGNGVMDIALGRLPAASLAEATFMVRKTIDYETAAEFGEWRDRIILVADDEISSLSSSQRDFIVLSEALAHGFLPSYIDSRKLYLTEFTAIQNIKPGSRLQFVKDWNEGALVINYVGHGSSVQMADEQVFLAADVGNLNNGLRLPLFTAFSCTIGNFAVASKSLSERLLLRDGGGVVATLTASELTYINPNNQLNVNFLADIFPSTPGTPMPLGLAIMLAKFESLASTNRLVEENSQKYNLLGDPALDLLSPRRQIVFEPADVTEMVAGTRHTVRGRVLDGNGQTDVSFSGTVKLIVRETDDESGYVREGDNFKINYRYPGGKVYEGTADVVAGTFQFSFKVPRFAETGPHGFVLAYANDNSTDAVGENYTVQVSEPAPGDPNAQPEDGAPRVDLGFRNSADVVKPGAVIEGNVRDADGVNILGTTPDSRLALLFDNTGLPLDVTEFFAFDHGGVDTSGTVTFPLPDLPVGEHRAVLKVSDTFGQTRLDTMFFSVTDPLDYHAEIVMNYPNPFSDVTHFMINLTDPATVRIEIFTVSGKRVRTMEERKDAGEQWITWDGRDNSGGGVANGTYLYVARISFSGVDRPAVVLRGKVVRIN